MEFSFAIVELGRYDVVLWLHTDVNPPNDEWDRAIDTLVAHNRRVAAPASRQRHFVITDGASPGARQRQRLNDEVYVGEPVKLAVITTVLGNPVKRGVATALTWINPQIQFFEPPQLARALAHVDLADHTSALWEQYGRMQAEMRPVRILRDIARDNGLPRIG